MMTIVKERGIETETWREHNFRWANTPGWAGFSFPVNEKGELLNDNEYARENYRLCVAGQMVDKDSNPIIDEGITRQSRKYRTNAEGRCRCGETVELYDQYMGACECPKCGQWYNLSGQELVPPRYWEENDGDGDFECAY